ncbi:MAG: glycosidase [Spirochaetes bacterium]|nr:MAG: glycosidase [Spirochaetota bacterium]
MKLKRYERNPVIKPEDFKKWDIGAVFNCGTTIMENGNVGMLYRAVPSGYRKNKSGNGYLDYVSSIGFAESCNGYDFEIREEPVITPQYEWDRYGSEDPRITRFEDGGTISYLITYTAMSSPAFSGEGDRVAVAQTEDFVSFNKHGVIIPGVNDKDAVFFPEKINGKIALLHRIPPDIQIAYFDDMEGMLKRDEGYWKRYLENYAEYNILERKYDWEAEKIGAGPPPLKTDEGWLLVYHAVGSDHVYRAGAALLDLDDPSRVIARSPVPVLEPETEYERYGDVDNVVFPEGAVVKDGELFVYYGAADKVCALATVGLRDMLNYLKGFR